MAQACGSTIQFWQYISGLFRLHCPHNQGGTQLQRLSDPESKIRSYHQKSANDWQLSRFAACTKPCKVLWCWLCRLSVRCLSKKERLLHAELSLEATCHVEASQHWEGWRGHRQLLLLLHACSCIQTHYSGVELELETLRQRLPSWN